MEFETHFDRWSPHAPEGWKGKQAPGQGAVYDLGSHLIDQTVQCFGMPRKVTGFVHRQRQPPSDLEDSCTVLLHYDGMLATVKASVLSMQTKQLRFKIRGDKGGYRKVACAHSATFRYLHPLTGAVSPRPARTPTQSRHEGGPSALW